MSDREPLLKNQVDTNQSEEPTKNALSSEVSCMLHFRIKTTLYALLRMYSLII